MKVNSMRKTRHSLLTSTNKQQEHQEMYNERLEKLLDKIQIQNRYSNRITITNLINLSRLQQVTKQVQEIKQARKMEQLFEVQLKNAYAQVASELKITKEQLNSTALSLLDAKKQIKKQSEVIKKLEKQNFDLQSTILSLKRKSLQQISEYKLNIVEDLIENKVKNFLIGVNWRESLLIQHCRESIKRNDFTNFFIDLQNKIQGFMKIKNKVVCPRLARSNSKQVYESGSRIKLSKSIESSNRNSERSNNIESIEQKNIRIPQSITKTHKRIKTLGPIKI